MNRTLISLALLLAAAATSFNAGAASLCVQNKITGIFEPRAGSKESDCAEVNASRAQGALAVAQGNGGHIDVASQGLKEAPGAQSKDKAAQVRTYQLKFTDVKIGLAMKRWMKEVGMQLAYEAGKDFDIPAEAEFVGTASDVIAKVMASLKQSSYPLRACEYDNRLILIKHRSEACPLESE